jgi:xanthine dehydrogenase accessory factor
MISAIVLAAGQATRFGQCKQLMRLGEKAMLQHVLDNLAQSKIDEVVVVLGARADEIREQIQFGNARVVMNPDYANGMSTSIQTGLRAINAEAAMIVLADQPFVTSRTLDLSIDEYRRSKPSVVIPTFNGFRGNPVIVDRSLFAEMMEIRGDIGCRSIFGNHPVHMLPVDDRGVVMDIDTMEDYERVTVIPSAAEREESPADIAETIVDLRRRRQPFAMATVVRAERPTSSKPGDKAIIAPDGTLTGWIGGSCAHDIVVRNALESLEEGSPRFLTLSSASPFDVKRQGVIDVPMQCYSGGVLDVFIEPNLPKPQMVVVGYETVARALVRISKTLQFHVTVVDPLATRESVPEADAIVNELKLPGGDFIVVATHGRYDEEALEQAVKTDAPYIALVASPKRAGTILQILRDRGVDVGRIKSPAGLDIGAQGAEEIALSIVAEIVQQRRARKAPEKRVVKEAIDPICNMTVEIATAKFTTEREGRRYYFCCAHCLRTFEKAHVA